MLAYWYNERINSSDVRTRVVISASMTLSTTRSKMCNDERVLNMGYLKALYPGKLGVILINIEISYIFFSSNIFGDLKELFEFESKEWIEMVLVIVWPQMSTLPISQSTVKHSVKQNALCMISFLHLLHGAYYTPLKDLSTFYLTTIYIHTLACDNMVNIFVNYKRALKMNRN